MGAQRHAQGRELLLPSSRGCGCPSSLVTAGLAVQLTATTWQAKAAGSAAAELFPAGPRAREGARGGREAGRARRSPTMRTGRAQGPPLPSRIFSPRVSSSILWSTVVYCCLLLSTMVHYGPLWSTMVYCGLLWSPVVDPDVRAKLTAKARPSSRGRPVTGRPSALEPGFAVAAVPGGPASRRRAVPRAPGQKEEEAIPTPAAPSTDLAGQPREPPAPPPRRTRGSPRRRRQPYPG